MNPHCRSGSPTPAREPTVSPVRSDVAPPGYPAAPLLQAATVLILREPAPGDEVEVFVQHRATTMDFAAGAVVFPGGRVDEIDRDTAASAHYPEPLLDAHASRWEHTSLAHPDPVQARQHSATLLATAIREVAEETGARLRPEQFRPWANWITPEGYRRRFDTFFYTVALRPDQRPEHLTTEASASEWLRPGELLRAHDQGRLTLLLPTHANVVRLHQLTTLDIITSEGGSTPVEPIIPRIE